jgi:signal peptidase II
MSLLSKPAALLVAVVMLVGCDHATKYAAKSELEAGAPRQLVAGVLDLRYVENRDVAFNLLAAVSPAVRAPLLLALGALALVALAVLLMRSRAATGERVALALLLAGAAGNYLDRVLRGYVVDFIHVPHWPVFNVADALVVAGVALLGPSRLRASRSRAVRPSSPS